MTKQKYSHNIVVDDLMPPQSPEAIKLMEDQKKAGEIAVIFRQKFLTKSSGE